MNIYTAMRATWNVSELAREYELALEDAHFSVHHDEDGVYVVLAEPIDPNSDDIPLDVVARGSLAQCEVACALYLAARDRQ